VVLESQAVAEVGVVAAAAGVAEMRRLAGVAVAGMEVVVAAGVVVDPEMRPAAVAAGLTRRISIARAVRDWIKSPRMAICPDPAAAKSIPTALRTTPCQPPPRMAI